MGSHTELRNRSTVLSMMAPSASSKLSSPPTRDWSSPKIRASDHCATSSSGSHSKYIRCTVAVRQLMRANPRREWA